MLQLSKITVVSGAKERLLAFCMCNLRKVTLYSLLVVVSTVTKVVVVVVAMVAIICGRLHSYITTITLAWEHLTDEEAIYFPNSLMSFPQTVRRNTYLQHLASSPRSG